MEGSGSGTTAAPATASPSARAIDWEDLLIAIDDHKVVPVVGRDLLVVPGESGPTLFHRELAIRLAAALDVPRADLPAAPELEDVARRFLAERPGEWDTLHARLRVILDKMPRVIPEPLRQLVSIEPLDMFVSTTFDDLLARALAGAGRTVEERHYRLYEELHDLPATVVADGARGPEDEGPSYVFHILGRPSTEPGAFVVNEEEQLEFLYQLQTKLDPTQGELRNLGLLLSRRHLLFLGCGLPDWPLRLFIRTLRGKRFHTERPSARARVADLRAERDASLVTFLQQYGTRVYAGNPADFVSELARRWSERHVSLRNPARPAMTAGAPLVLLACAPEDRAAAQPVADKLAQWSIASALVPLRDADAAAQRAQIDGAAGYVAFLSDRSLGPTPERDEPLLASFRNVDARCKAADRGPLVTLAITLDDAAARKHRAQRTWGEWLRLARRLHRPTADDVAWRIAESLLDTRKLGLRTPIRLYIAYADADRAYREQFESHLGTALARSTWLSVWHRERTPLGAPEDTWQSEIGRADVVALLVSVDLLADRLDEIDRAMALYQDRKAVVLPILVRSCEWQELLGALAPLPADQTYIAAQRDPDGAWRDVVQALLLATFDFMLGAPPP
ncbi:MAG: SIR2 family protein [Minicystis sp.]